MIFFTDCSRMLFVSVLSSNLYVLLECLKYCAFDIYPTVPATLTVMKLTTEEAEPDL